MYLKGRKGALIKQLERDMARSSRAQEYEKAAKIRNQLFALKELSKQVIFSDKEFLDLSKDHALNELVKIFGLENVPKRIEGFDISHMSGVDTVASMVVFTNGVADKGAYRKFKMRLPGNDDFGHMREVLHRRLSDKNTAAWGLPNLFLIDGGKGQLGAALDSIRQKTSIPAIGLAKQFEQIVVNRERSNLELNRQELMNLGGVVVEDGDDFVVIQMPIGSNLIKLLQRIRDESHRFAITYHGTLKVKRQTFSWLDEVPGIGPKTKKRLIRTLVASRA